MLHNYLYTLKLVGFFNLIHLFRCPLWLYANWRCPARLFSSALLVPIAFGLGDSQCFHPLLSFGVSFFAAFILIFGFAQIEDRVKRLSCFCSPRGPNGGRVARGACNTCKPQCIISVVANVFLPHRREDRPRSFCIFQLRRPCNKCRRPVHCLPSTDYGWAVNYD